MADPQTLSPEEVINVHEALVAHFAEDGDPIDPPGVKSIALLESAVARQHTGFGHTLKYPEPRHNAATLMYGICMDHPFHNGNKRAALVAALVHLDRNNYIPDKVTHDELYNMLLALADHRLTSAASTPRGGVGASGSPVRRRNPRLTPDEEVRLLGEWLRRRTRPTDKREHPLTFRQLRRVLGRFGCRLGKPHGNFIDVYRDEEWEESGWFGLGKPKLKKRTAKVTQVSYAGEGSLVPVNTIKMVRRHCHLLPDNGVDSRAFYDEEATVDFLVNQYRNLLRRLARV